MKGSDFRQLSIVITEHDRAWAYCCFHNDTVRPNLSISLLDKYYGRWKCWACGRNGCLTKQQMSELNLSESTIYKNNKSTNTRWRMFNQSCYDNLQRFPLLKLGLAKELNVSTKSLDEWLVGFDGQSFTIPMYRDDLVNYDREDGMCGIQRRFSDGSKRCTTGSNLGIMCPKGYIGDYYIFICEGFSDGISVYNLGLDSIARPHCRYTDGIEELLGNVLDGIEKVIIIPDNDVVGKDGAKKLGDTLSGMCYCDIEGWDVDCNIAVFPLDGAKDIRQLIQLKGKNYVRRELKRYI